MKNLSEHALVSVILPCFNEHKNILPLIKEIHDILTLWNWEHEIVVVDDNSPDGTYDIVKAEALPFVKAVLRKDMPSLGGSIRTGIENAKGEILVFMDSDFNHAPEYLPILLANLNFYDCASATRFVYGGSSHNKFRFFLSWIFNIGVRITTRHFITDTLFGYLAIKKEILTKVDFQKIFYGQGDYCIRLMYYLQLLKISILQIPAIHTARVHGAGNTRFLRTLLLYSRETLKLGFKRKPKYV